MDASDKYRLRILPAGRNDRVAEISDSEGNVLKYVFCPHRLGNNADGLDARIGEDLASMEAEEFAERYGV